MEGLIQGILQYSRIGRVKEKERQVDFEVLLQDVIDSVSPPDSIQITVEPGMPVMMFEYKHAETMFHHLLDNAVKFMDKPEGQVRVRAEDGGDHWKFSVADNGPGIDPANYEKIFQIFQTLAARDERESTGIGLTLVKKIVDTSGGKIWVESEIGAGTTFFLTLPTKGENE
jgi:signal transduction histidine kinase